MMRHVEKSSPFPDKVLWYAIHEGYYDNDGMVNGWSQNPDYPRGDDVDDLAGYVEMMAEALTYPVLDYDTGEEV